MTEWIPEDDWATIVRSMPIPSVDLLITTDDGVVLAERTNEPAKGEWFVPGGRIHKSEKVREAVHRVAKAELGVEITIREELGLYNHFYEVSDVPGATKHYVAHGFVVDPDSDPKIMDNQHAQIQTFQTLPTDCHEYVVEYVEDSSFVSPESV